MDWKKIVPAVIGIALALAGSLLGYNLKGEVCSGVVPGVSAQVK